MTLDVSVVAWDRPVALFDLECLAADAGQHAHGVSGDDPAAGRGRVGGLQAFAQRVDPVGRILGADAAAAEVARDRRTIHQVDAAAHKQESGR